MTDSKSSRRDALKCLGFGGATAFVLCSGVFAPLDLAEAAGRKAKPAGDLLFVQLSDSHIGFNKPANPDVKATLQRTIDMVNGLSRQPAFILHTGDITQLSRPQEFDDALQLLSGLKARELHTTPGEHDVIDGVGAEYFKRFDKVSGGKGYYSFDAHGVHFIALINVLHFKAGGLGVLGDEQIEWLENDLKGRSSSTPIVVFAHMPLWTIYAPWGWGTGDADRAFSYLRRFGSVTVLNGHIHQIVQKVEGHITFHTARSTAFPQPAAGTPNANPGPLTLPASQLPAALGLTSVTIQQRKSMLLDSTLA